VLRLEVHLGGKEGGGNKCLVGRGRKRACAGDTGGLRGSSSGSAGRDGFAVSEMGLGFGVPGFSL
jgi:hypothetical protein